LVYEKNKNLHDLNLQEVKRIEFKKIIIFYKNGIKQIEIKEIIDSLNPRYKELNVLKNKMGNNNSYKIARWNMNYTASEFLSRYDVLMIGIEYNFNIKFSLVHNIGIATSEPESNSLLFNEDVFHYGGIVNKTEFRNYLLNKPLLNSKKVKRTFIGLDIKHRYGYKSISNISAYDNITFSVNKVGVYCKIGIQKIETNSIFIEISAGPGLNFIWGEKKEVNYSIYNSSNAQYETKTNTKYINDINPTFALNLKIGVGNFK
jgi:hypothetical protein